ncbi:hypothetical protein [Methylococcus sp. EFPC2]|uniref:hypothetical protein n=1 Tax=Methylococcus sp. EFPC2 TaxID=2812648 RepID=UPI001966D65A|nr:hypothetical protein [Methylococcus sp. EFPC2]QSA98050.1 hypothetical protein JWZ97_04305 [Methylococcus sp. EFPC2]
MFKKWFNRWQREPSPEQIRAEAREKLDECNRYFREMADLSDKLSHVEVDLQDTSDRALVADLQRLFGLAPAMAKIQAIAAWNLLALEETPETHPVRTVAIDGRRLQVFNGGNDRFEGLVDELMFALERADQDDPEIRRIDCWASERYRQRMRRPTLSSVHA